MAWGGSTEAERSLPSLQLEPCTTPRGGNRNRERTGPSGRVGGERLTDAADGDSALTGARSERRLYRARLRRPPARLDDYRRFWSHGLRVPAEDRHLRRRADDGVHRSHG